MTSIRINEEIIIDAGSLDLKIIQNQNAPPADIGIDEINLFHQYGIGSVVGSVERNAFENHPALIFIKYSEKDLKKIHALETQLTEANKKYLLKNLESLKTKINYENSFILLISE